MQYGGVNYLKDVDDGFYCADYIKAWIFESQLKDYIHRKFGYGWFKQKKAGDFLKELWSYGQKYNTAEILEQLDFEGLDVNYLIDSLTTEIKKYRERI
jgi:Zn-dependent M32 family carboxypeptidase